MMTGYEYLPAGQRINASVEWLKRFCSDFEKLGNSIDCNITKNRIVGHRFYRLKEILEDIQNEIKAKERQIRKGGAGKRRVNYKLQVTGNVIQFPVSRKPEVKTVKKGRKNSQ